MTFLRARVVIAAMTLDECHCCTDNYKILTPALFISLHCILALIDVQTLLNVHRYYHDEV